MFDTDPIATKRKAWVKRPDKSVKLIGPWAVPEIGAGANVDDLGGGDAPTFSPPVRDDWKSPPLAPISAPTSVDSEPPIPYAGPAGPSTPPPAPSPLAGPLPAADVPRSGSGAPASRVPATQQPASGAGGPPLAPSPGPDRGDAIQPGQSSFRSSEDIINVAKTAIGSKYRWGGPGGRSSFDPNFVGSDCSGFVAWAYYNATGIKLPAFTGSIYSVTKPISRTDAVPGDIIMWGMQNSDPAEQHTGIYLGGNQWIHDSSVNPNGGVSITPLWSGVEFRRAPGIDVSNASKPQTFDAPPRPDAQPAAPKGVANPTGTGPRSFADVPESAPSPQAADEQDRRAPGPPVAPKDWFTYSDKGRKVLKVTWANGETTFADQGEGQGDPGTVLDTGTLGMGSGAATDDSGGGGDTVNINDEQPWSIPVPDRASANNDYNMGANPTSMPGDQLRTPGFGYDPTQMHAPQRPADPDIPQKQDVRDNPPPPQDTVFDIPAVKQGFSAETQPLKIAQPDAQRRPISAVQGEMADVVRQAAPDPNEGVTELGKQTAGLPANPWQVHEEVQDRFTKAVVPQPVRDAPVVGGLIEQALDPTWMAGGIEAAGTELALGTAGRIVGKAAPAVARAAQRAAPEIVDHVSTIMSPVAKAGADAILRGLDRIQPGLGQQAAARLPAQVYNRYAAAMGMSAFSGLDMGLMTDPNDPNYWPKIAGAATVGALAPFAVHSITPGFIYRFNKLLAPVNNLPEHVAALVANYAHGLEGSRMAGDLMHMRIVDVLADKNAFGMPKPGTGLDKAVFHMEHEETKAFGPAMTPAQKALADDLVQHGDAMRKEGMKLGFIHGDATRHPGVETWVPHLYEEHMTDPVVAVRKGLNPADTFSHARDPNFPTLRAKSAQAKLTPVDSVSEPWRIATTKFYASKAKREFVRGLEKTGGRDVIQRGRPGKGNIPDDWVHGGKWDVPGLDQFSVSPDMATVLDNLHNPSALRSHLGGFFDSVAEIKKAMFAPSGFHLANELRQVLAANGKEGFPIFAKSLYHMAIPGSTRKFMLANAPGLQRAADAGVTLLRGNSGNPDVGAFGMGKLGGTAVRAGWSGAATGAAAFAQSKRNNDPDQVALENGLKAAGWGAALGVAGGPISDRLWNHAVPTMKYMTWEVMAKRYGDKPAAEFVNEVFGGQSLDAIARSKTVQDVLRFTVLAPDWQEGWVRQIGNGLRGVAAVPYAATHGGRTNDPLGTANTWYWTNAAVTSAFMLEGLNLALNGHFTNENGPNNQLKLELTGMYDRMGIPHRDDRGRPYRVYEDILGAFRGLVEAPLDPGKFLTAREGIGPEVAGELATGKDYTGKDIVPPGEDPLKNAALRVGHLLSRFAPASGSQIVQSQGDPAWLQAASYVTGSRTTHQSPIAEQLQMRDKALKDASLTPQQIEAGTNSYTNLQAIADRKFEQTLSRKDLTHQQIDQEIQKITRPNRIDVITSQLPPGLFADPARSVQIRDALNHSLSFGTASSDYPADITPETMVDTKAAHDRYWGAATGPGMEQVPETTRRAVQSKELAKMALEFDVEPQTLLDSIKAQDRGLGQPPPVPGVNSAAIDGWVDQWTAAGQSVEDPLESSAAKRAAIDAIAEQYHLSPDTVWQRIKLRRLPAQKPTELENSRNKALDVLFAAHDPGRFPKYRDEQGQPMGGAEQWKSFDAQIAAIKNNHDKLLPENKKLLEARDRATAYQRKYILNAPDATEYERWFGVGRGMNEAMWAKYKSGGFPHYKDTKDPAENANRDKLTQQYKASTPAERRTTLVQVVISGKPETVSLEAANRHIKAVVDKGWEKALGLDATGTAAVSSQEGQ